MLLYGLACTEMPWGEHFTFDMRGETLMVALTTYILEVVVVVINQVGVTGTRSYHYGYVVTHTVMKVSIRR